MDTKICNHCNEEKPLSCFHFRENRNLYEGSCRQCDARRARERRKRDDVKEKIKKSQQKHYQKNKEVLNEKSRAYHQENKDKLNAQQKQYYLDNAEHLKEQTRLNRERTKEKALTGQLEKPTITEKTCTKCGLTKDVSGFTFRRTRNVYESVCKTCNTERERERRKLHKDSINTRRKEIQKPLTTEQKLVRSLRSRLNICVIERFGKNMYFDLLGCDRKFLMRWVEYNFKLDEHQEMDWDNYGTVWHIDHVTPCASFDLTNEDQQNKCFHWTNLSPVLKEYNLSKGDKIKPIDQIRQEIRVNNFLKKLEANNKLKYSIKS